MNRKLLSRIVTWVVVLAAVAAIVFALNNLEKQVAEHSKQSRQHEIATDAAKLAVIEARDQLGTLQTKVESDAAGQKQAICAIASTVKANVGSYCDGVLP